MIAAFIRRQVERAIAYWEASKPTNDRIAVELVIYALARAGRDPVVAGSALMVAAVAHARASGVDPEDFVGAMIDAFVATMDPDDPDEPVVWVPDAPPPAPPGEGANA